VCRVAGMYVFVCVSLVRVYSREKNYGMQYGK
jgi:hypothetical protein